MSNQSENKNNKKQPPTTPANSLSSLANSEEWMKPFEDADLIPKDANFRFECWTENGEIFMKSEGGLYIETMMNIFSNIIIQMTKHVLASPAIKTAEELKEIKEELFDLLNGNFSGILRVALPEIALRPNLTEDAMRKVMEEETKLINNTYEKAVADGRVKKLNPKNKNPKKINKSK